MNKMKDQIGLGTIFCFLCLILLIWSVWPLRSETRVLVFEPGELQVLVPAQESSDVGPVSGNSSFPMAFPDTRKVILNWQPIVRKGDPSRITIKFTGSDASNVAGAISNEGSFENLYNAYTVTALARVELPGFIEEPAGISGKVLPEGQDLEFFWKIIPGSDGLYNGTAWLYLQFFPIQGGDLIDQAISAQSFEIKVASIFGINSNYLRVASVLGFIIGVYAEKKRLKR